MKEEEKKELEDLQAKDQLNDDETARAAALEEMLANEEPLSDEDEFDKAFAEATGEEPPADQDKDEPASDKKKDDPDDDQDDDDKPDNDSIFNAAPDDDLSNKDSGDDKDDPDNIIAQLKADLQKEQQRTKSWEGRIEAANRRAKELEERLKEKDNQNGQDNLSPGNGEENEVLQEFIEEFPSLEGPIKVLIKRQAGKMVKTELDKIRPILEKAEESSKVTEEEAEVRHFETIDKAHPDWKNIWESGALKTWIDNQPKFLQTSLNLVIEEGDAEEIVEMFDSYKKATKRVKKPDNLGKTSKKDKLKGLEAVETQSGGPPKQKKKIKKDDFDSAWDDALSKS